MSHLVSVLHQVSQQVVHVQDAALGVLQVVGLHGGLAELPHIHVNTVKERRVTIILFIWKRKNNGTKKPKNKIIYKAAKRVTFYS